MKILLTGICGFAGSTLARALLAERTGLELVGLDNLSRRGSHLNLEPLRALGIRIEHGDVRNASDVDALPAADALIDCAANPSVLAGIGPGPGSRQLVEHNLSGTLNLLEYCKRHRAAFTDAGLALTGAQACFYLSIIIIIIIIMIIIIIKIITMPY